MPSDFDDIADDFDDLPDTEPIIVTAKDIVDIPCREIPNSPHVVFDIETGPAWEPGDSIDVAKAYCQPLGIDFDPASLGSHPGEFDPATVKLGNLKDKAKIEAKIEDGRRSHRSMVADFERRLDEGEPAFWNSIIDNAALSPITGRVLAIGYTGEQVSGLNPPLVITVDTFANAEEDSEFALLSVFWTTFVNVRDDGHKFIGWNIAGFDVPFLVWRSAALGVDIPRGVYRGKWLSDTFIDLMDRWGRLYDPWKGQSSSAAQAKRISRFLGCHRPDDEIEGKDFWRYFLSSDEAKRALSIRYLENDVYEETIIAKRLGVI